MTDTPKNLDGMVVDAASLVSGLREKAVVYEDKSMEPHSGVVSRAYLAIARELRGWAVAAEKSAFARPERASTSEPEAGPQP